MNVFNFRQKFIFILTFSFGFCIVYFMFEFLTKEYIDSNEIYRLINLFKDTGFKSGSDKTTFHHYEHAYGQFLGPLRNKNLKFLEIGLGCDMKYGPGRSIVLWKEYLPKASISILEFDAECAQRYVSQVNKMFYGDQSNFQVLTEVGKFGPYDVIVDDGGHTRNQQINSLIGLWPFVKSKGFYIIEDIYTSFLPSFNDRWESSFDIIVQLLVLINESKDISAQINFPNITINENSRKIAKDLLHISCYQRICLLGKK